MSGDVVRLQFVDDIFLKSFGDLYLCDQIINVTQASSSEFFNDTRTLVLRGNVPMITERLRALPEKYARYVAVLLEGEAPKAKDESWTCKCGRLHLAASARTSGGCSACAPEKSWEFDEARRQVAVSRGSYHEGTPELLDRVPPPAQPAPAPTDHSKPRPRGLR